MQDENSAFMCRSGGHAGMQWRTQEPLRNLGHVMNYDLAYFTDAG